MISFTLYLEGWRPTTKRIKANELLSALEWPIDYYQEMEDTHPLHGHPSTLRLNLACATLGDFNSGSASLRRYWRQELNRLARWLEMQAANVVSRALSSGLRLVVWIDVWLDFEQPAPKLTTSVLAAAARLRIPIRVVCHIGDDET